MSFTEDSSSNETNHGEEFIAKKRGVKQGSRRGSYKKTFPNDTKLRIIDVAENDGDWKAAARLNDVPMATAYGWRRRADDSAKKRGGYKKPKLSEHHVENMLSYVEENPLITLREI